MDNGEDFDFPLRRNRDYSLSGKIMMSAMIVLFFVVIIMVCLHLYARWYLLRSRRRHTRCRSHFVFSRDIHYSSPLGPSVGLDAAVVTTLPIFSYSSKTHTEPIDCAVCLSEFGENEAGRILPRCNHCFHIECIDMWFHSHSTCPLCRTPVEADQRSESAGEVVISIHEQSVINEPGPSSGLCSDCEHELEYPVNRARPSSSLGTSSLGARRKPLEMVGVSIEVPTRNETLAGYNSPATQSFKSPTSRGMSLSFKRILSRERRGSDSPIGNSVIPIPVGVSVVERGGDE